MHIVIQVEPQQEEDILSLLFQHLFLPYFLLDRKGKKTQRGVTACHHLKSKVVAAVTIASQDEKRNG